MYIRLINSKLKTTKSKSSQIKLYLYIFLSIEFLISFTYLYDVNSYINIQLGFISSFIVTISSFFSYRRFINSSLADELSEDEIEDVKSKRKLLFASLGGFFSYYRLIGYLIFIFIFLYLVDSKLLDIKTYIMGMSLSFIVPLVVFIFNRQTCSKDDDE